MQYGASIGAIGSRPSIGGANALIVVSESFPFTCSLFWAVTHDVVLWHFGVIVDLNVVIGWVAPLAVAVAGGLSVLGLPGAVKMTCVHLPDFGGLLALGSEPSEAAEAAATRLALQ